MQKVRWLEIAARQTGIEGPSPALRDSRAIEGHGSGDKMSSTSVAWHSRSLKGNATGSGCEELTRRAGVN